MSSFGRPASVDSDDRHYERHRAAVMALLRARFGSRLNERDREDLYHEAWTGVLEHRRRGRPTPDLLGLLKTIAWRRGRDRLRNLSAEPSDPVEGALSRVFDNRPSPHELVSQRLDADLCHQLIESLNERQRTIIKLRCEWELSPAEIQDVLGISRKAYEKQLTRAHKRLATGLGEVEDGTWRERHQALLLACEAGVASADERAQAERLVARDPASRAMLRRMRGAAALIPMPAFLVRCFTRARLGASGHVAAAERMTQLAGAGGGRAIGGIALGKLAALSATSLAVAGGIAAGVAGHNPPARPTPVKPVARPSVVAPATTESRAPATTVGSSQWRPRVARHATTSRKVAPPPAAPAPQVSRSVSPPSEPAPPPAASMRRPPAAAGDGSQEFGP